MLSQRIVIFTKELNNAFHTWNVSLDKFMMNPDIKLFFMSLGCSLFGDLNERTRLLVFIIMVKTSMHYQTGDSL